MGELWPILAIIVLSILQGASSVAPISSIGHLALASRLLSFDSANLLFATALHIGSFVAIFLWFRRDVDWLWQNFWASWPHLATWVFSKEPQSFSYPREHHIPYYFVFSLIPTALIGFLLRSLAEEIFDRVQWVSVLLVVNGIAILATARWTGGERTLGELRLWEYLVIGVFQGFAVLPGISRLGFTLCAGLFRRLNWYEALRLAFVLALPAIAGDLLLQSADLIQELAHHPNVIMSLLIGNLIVFLLNWIFLHLFTRQHLLERHTLNFFGFYCFMLGTFTFIYFIPQP